MLRIGILTDQFITWGGGIDFIRLILNGINSLNEQSQNEITIYVFIPKQSENKIKVKNALKIVLNSVVTNKYQLQRIIPKTSIVNSFNSINSNIKNFFYDGTEADLVKKILQHKIDFVVPAFVPLSHSFPVPWVGYIYDFQHKYYPEFFTKEEILRRDTEFISMLNNAKTVIVNAQTVKSDITKFIGVTSTKIITLPFCPVLNLEIFEKQINLEKYNLHNKYFMISNQFWKHKDHVTAIRAFRIFLDELPTENIGLVCTGQTHDSRFPDYFNSLQELITELKLNDKIRILGYIPKSDQLQILKNCIAIIQPTLFEGGPGGGAVYESVGYGIPSIVSDIPVNKELDDESVTFFVTGSSIDLANKMIEVFNKERYEYSTNELVNKNKIALLKMGEQILNTFNQ
ncbi:glycosyltransferase family 4 protein [Flavobacterium sp. GSP14]|uniref:glycosyltransferase family 4 protein n=1 Tax=Flavobacterium sp. GSP14 TaxID=3401734 RepID=UPI003AB0B2F8